MAKRKFELPGIQDLSKDQEAARALPKEGQHLIIGGPGTGKSVLALIRTRRHQRDKDDYLFLVFNHLLDRASNQLFGDGFVSRTWISWFLETFQDIAGQSVPRLAAERLGGFRPMNWDGVNDIINALPSVPKVERPFLIIDEGQDMPPGFYESLVNLGFERFFVAADQNQQITEENSSREDMENHLVIKTKDVIELKQNYRNCYPVARLAQAFYTGDPASPPPELPEPGASHVSKLYTYAAGDFDRVIRGILRLADRDPRQLIGVIAPNNKVRGRYFEKLRTLDIPTDNPRPSIETFHGSHRPDIAFNEGGILVINAQACKGLEFDTAILVDIDKHNFKQDNPDAAKRLFYVMVARAKYKVFMFRDRSDPCHADAILPSDSDMLQRKEV